MLIVKVYLLTILRGPLGAHSTLASAADLVHRPFVGNDALRQAMSPWFVV